MLHTMSENKVVKLDSGSSIFYTLMKSPVTDMTGHITRTASSILVMETLGDQILSSDYIFDIAICDKAAKEIFDALTRNQTRVSELRYIMEDLLVQY